MYELGLWDEDLLGGNNKLFNVLKAYANYDNEVGYVQGINYIVAMLLFYIPDEEHVFWCLCSLMAKRQKRALFTPGFPRLLQLLQILDDKMSAEFPEIKQHLESNSLVI